MLFHYPDPKRYTINWKPERYEQVMFSTLKGPSSTPPLKYETILMNSYKLGNFGTSTHQNFQFPEYGMGIWILSGSTQYMIVFYLNFDW